MIKYLNKKMFDDSFDSNDSFDNSLYNQRHENWSVSNTSYSSLEQIPFKIHPVFEVVNFNIYLYNVNYKKFINYLSDIKSQVSQIKSNLKMIFTNIFRIIINNLEQYENAKQLINWHIDLYSKKLQRVFHPALAYCSHIETTLRKSANILKLLRFIVISKYFFMQYNLQQQQQQQSHEISFSIIDDEGLTQITNILNKMSLAINSRRFIEYLWYKVYYKGEENAQFIIDREIDNIIS